MTSIDPKGTRVVLIGCSTYDDKKLSPIKQIEKNICDLAKVFRDPDVIGVAEENVVELLDPSTRDDAIAAIKLAARQATDTLIVYYAGHGMIGRNKPELYLAVRTTPNDDPDDLGISFNDTVRSNVLHSPARKRILILDCCYSGRALRYMGSGDLVRANVTDALPEGAYALAASRANQLATFGSHPKYTDFTGELIRVLRDGVEGGPQYITTELLYEEVCKAFRSRKGMPQPEQLIFNEGGKIAVAVNVRARPAVIPEPEALPAEKAGSQPVVGTAAARLSQLDTDSRPVGPPPLLKRRRWGLLRRLPSAPRAGWARLTHLLSVLFVLRPPRPSTWLARLARIAFLPGYLARAFLRPPTLSAAVGAGVGVAIAMLHSKGWSGESLDPLQGYGWNQESWPEPCILFLLWGPAGNIWVAMVSGALVGSRELFSARDVSTAQKVAALRPRFWEMVRTRDPLLGFALKWWTGRAIKSLPGAALTAAGALVGALIGGDVTGSNFGVKMGVIIGTGLTARVPGFVVFLPLMWTMLSAVICFALHAFAAVVSWLLQIDLDIGSWSIWYVTTWSLLMVLSTAVTSLSDEYVSDADIDVPVNRRWVRPGWVLIRVAAVLVGVGFWWPRFGDQFARLDGASDGVTVVAFAPRSSAPLVGTFDGAVQVWPSRALSGVTISGENRTRIESLAFSADGTMVLAGCGRMTDEEDEYGAKKAEDCVIKVWPLPGGKSSSPGPAGVGLPQTLEGHSWPVWSVAISPVDPKLVISAAGDGVRIWDLATGKERQGPLFDKNSAGGWAGHDGWVEGIAFSPDGRHLVSAGSDGTVRICGLDDSGEGHVRVFAGHQGPVSCVEYSHDGQRVASGGRDGSIRIWNVENGTQLAVCQANAEAIFAVAFSPSDRWLVSGGNDAIVRIWNTNSGQEISQFRGHFLGVTSVAVSADGTLILVGDWVGHVRLWRRPFDEAALEPGTSAK